VVPSGLKSGLLCAHPSVRMSRAHSKPGSFHSQRRNLAPRSVCEGYARAGIMNLHDDAAENRTRQPGHVGFADPDGDGAGGLRPRRLPEIGRQIGKLMYEVRKASNDFKFQMEEELRKVEDVDRSKKEEQRMAMLALAAPAVVDSQVPNRIWGARD